MVDKNYKKYLAGDNWKCGKSPTGAHHWVGLPNTQKGGYCIFLCKYCSKTRKLPVDFNVAVMQP